MSLILIFRRKKAQIHKSEKANVFRSDVGRQGGRRGNVPTHSSHPGLERSDGGGLKPTSTHRSMKLVPITLRTEQKSL